MSIKALNWAFNLQLHGGQKAVLLALANHANADGDSYPSIATIVLQSGMSERSVQTILRQLKDMGAIQTTTKPGSRSTHNLDLSWQPTPAATAPKPIEEPSKEERVPPCIPPTPKIRRKLSSDWQPSESGVAFAQDRQLDPLVLREEFADYHIARGNLMLDWDRAWQTWCRNAVRFAAKDRARQKPTKPTVDQRIMQIFGIPDDDGPAPELRMIQ